MARKYSVNVEDDMVVSVEVDGVKYDSVDDVPDPEDQERLSILISDMEDMSRMDFDELASQPTGRADLLPKIIYSTFLGVAVLMLVIAAISAVNTGRALSREQSATGRVVELVERRGQNGDIFYHPVVELSLPDEERRTIQLTDGSWPAAYEVGQHVTVRYDPARPRNARIQSFSSTLGMWIVALITGVLGAAFLLATLLARWIFKGNAAEKEVP